MLGVFCAVAKRIVLFYLSLGLIIVFVGTWSVAHDIQVIPNRCMDRMAEIKDSDRSGIIQKTAAAAGYYGLYPLKGLI